MKENYIFKSDRLGFRNWIMEDLAELALMSADEEVMEFFPKTLSLDESNEFLHRLQKQYEDNGYTYFATERLDTGEFIGFIGLAYQDYEAEFTPATDIGWRLKRSAWGEGYATEGAMRCLDFAFETIKLEKIISVCTIGNDKSEHVMQKIGMIKKGVFKHTKLSDFPRIENCVWYEIDHAQVR